MEIDDIIAKESRNWTSGELGCLNFLDFFRFSDAESEKLSSSAKSFPSSDAEAVGKNHLKNTSAKPCEEKISIEPLYEPSNLQKILQSTLKIFTPDNDEIKRTETINEHAVYWKQCFFSTDFFQIVTTFLNLQILLFSYSTPSLY